MMRKLKKGFLFLVKKLKRGFTLIELLIVIAILGILGSVVFVSVAHSKEKANTAVAKATARDLMNNLSSCEGVLAPNDPSLGGGSICASDPENPEASIPTWPTLEKTGYVYSVVADDDTKDKTFSFSLEKENRPKITAHLVNGGISVEETAPVVAEVTKVLSGNITYANLANSSMSNVTITLKQDGKTMYTTTTLAKAGDYSFPTVAQGTYDVYFSKSENAGGINSTDAAQLNSWVTNHYFGGIRILAGDVYQNSSKSTITAEDSNAIMNYFMTGGNPPFPVGQWVFTKSENVDTSYADFPIPFATSGGFSNISITIKDSDLVQNFVSLAFGDVNKSYTPS
jgi:prepilin-type N-terminal cleavage/methylation domain-containing protein